MELLKDKYLNSELQDVCLEKMKKILAKIETKEEVGFYRDRFFKWYDFLEELEYISPQD